MISVYDLKPHLQSLLKPVVDRLAKAKITPNQISLVALAFALGAGLFMALLGSLEDFAWIFYLLPLALLIKTPLNTIDGLLARDYKLESQGGFYLNEMGNLLGEVFLYLPLLFIPGISKILVLFNVLALLFTEFAGVLGACGKGHRRYEGPMGRTDRALAFGIVGIIYGAGLLGLGWINFILTLVFAAQCLTIYNRVYRALTK